MNLAVTFDIDWAPDWAVDLCQKICSKSDASSSFFATHQCDILHDLRKVDGTELGVHPNFLGGSSHGSAIKDIVEFVLDLVPDAVSIRTHSLVQSSPILDHIVTETNLQNDVSLFMPFVPMQYACKMYFGEHGRFLRRMPYYWEDVTAAGWPGWDWARAPVLDPIARYKIYNFHPIHIALNTADMAAYQSLKQSLGGKHLSLATREDCEPFVNRGHGARTFLEALLKVGGPRQFLTVSQLADASELANPL
jgi:hypothetical protein